MRTIFTRAIAARKVMRLLDDLWGISSPSLTSCRVRLETDLGIPGDVLYDVLEAMAAEHHVDMSEFDCDDYITRESPAAAFVRLLLVFACPAFAILAFPPLPQLLGVSLSILLMVLTVWVFARLTHQPHPELRLDDLIRSVEARRWVSPKKRVK